MSSSGESRGPPTSSAPGGGGLPGDDAPAGVTPTFPRFGRYTVLGHWARARVGDIYVAGHTGAAGFDRLVALKVLRSDLAQDEPFREVFFAEAGSGALLDHPNVVRTFEVGENEGRLYMVMEFIHGESVGQVLHACEGGLPIPVALAVARSTARALDYIHRQRETDGSDQALVHRNVSPSSILLTHDGGVKLLDFGLMAEASRGEEGGSANYGCVSPEQAAGGELDGRSDIYSLGVVLWQMLTGLEVSDGDVLPPPSHHGVGDEALDTIVLKATSRFPKSRYESAAELRRAMDVYVEEHLASADPAAMIRTLMKERFADRADQARQIRAFVTQLDALPSGRAQPVESWNIPAVPPAPTPLSSDRAEPPPPATRPPVAGRPVSDPAPSRATPPDPAPSRSPRHGLVGCSLVVLLVLAAMIGAWLMLRPPGGTRTVTITSEPVGARVMLDGRPVGRTPVSLELERQRKVRVNIARKGFRTFKRSIGPHDPDGLRAKLTRVDLKGSLMVATTPPGAKVSVDGEPAGISPTVLDLWVGEPHNVVITEPGYTPVARTVRFDAKDTVELRIELEPAATGSIRAECPRASCAVYVDGKAVGNTPVPDATVVANRPVEVKLIRGGKVVLTRTVTVAPSQVVLIALEEAPLPPDAGISPPPIEPVAAVKQPRRKRARRGQPRRKRARRRRPRRKRARLKPVPGLQATLTKQAADGGATLPELRRSMKRLRAAATQCYHQKYRETAFEGRLQVRFVVSPKGRAKDLSVTGNVVSRIAACLRAGIGGVSFPKKTSETRVRLQIKFTSK